MFIITGLAVLHFVYQAILLPSIRLSLRFRLFALRDRLRALLARDQEALEAFRIQHAAINNSIRMLSKVDFAFIWRVESQLRLDKAMRARIEKRIKIVEEFEEEEFQAILKATNRTFRAAVLANAGAWFFYIVPIALVFLCLKKLKIAVKGALSVPEGELSKVIEMEPVIA